MKVWITGASGMVGKNLIEASAGLSYVISGTGRDVDLFEPAAIRDHIRAFRPDLIIHAAGKVGGIQANMAAKDSFLYENTVMGLNLVREASRAKVPRLLNLGSSCMYPKDLGKPLAEQDLLQAPLEPTNEGYALAKIVVAKMCEYLTKSNSAVSYKTLIPCNLYGRWDHFESSRSHLIPSIIVKIRTAMIEGIHEIEIWGTGEARREFMYSGDFAQAVFNLIKHYDEIPEYLNVGLGYDYSINEYYQAAAKVAGFHGTFRHNADRPTGMKQKLMDIGKLPDYAKVDSGLEQGLLKTFQFYVAIQKSNH